MASRSANTATRSSWVNSFAFCLILFLFRCSFLSFWVRSFFCFASICCCSFNCATKPPCEHDQTTIPNCDRPCSANKIPALPGPSQHQLPSSVNKEAPSYNQKKEERLARKHTKTKCTDDYETPATRDTKAWDLLTESYRGGSYTCLVAPIALSALSDTRTQRSNAATVSKDTCSGKD